MLEVADGKVVTVAIFYKASELIGSGRFAEVYRAFDVNAQTDVALKVYRGVDSATHAVAKNEQATLIALEELNSRYFPKLRKAAKHRLRNESHPVLAMELGSYQADGGGKRLVSLHDVIPPSGGGEPSTLVEKDFWAAGSLVAWIAHLLEAVMLMHSKGIVHRDIKPANILLRREAGRGEVVPFFLDFNSASGPGVADSRSGTAAYLPPEVRSGARSEPTPADDLWAVAMVAWELLHGAGAPVGPKVPRHALVRGEVPPEADAALRRALSLREDERFATGHELRDVLQACSLQVTSRVSTTEETRRKVSAHDFALAQAAAPRLRLALEEALAPKGEITVPKTVSDGAGTLLSWLNEEHTQSLDLVSELVRLGPRAIPVCLEQGFKLTPNSVTFAEVVQALKSLALQDPEVARTALDMYSLSSNFSVRSLCRSLCAELEFFPATLLDSLTSDEGLLLPSERLELAQLCLRFGNDSDSMLALSKYLCREYIINQGAYKQLARIAGQMGSMRFAMKALLVAQDTASHIWEELSEFEKVPAGSRREMEKGLLELMADAFAAMGDEALDVLKRDGVPRESTGDSRLRVFRRFVDKLARRHPPTKEWVTRIAESHADDPDFRYLIGRLGPVTSDSMSPQLIKGMYIDYLDRGRREALNELRFLKDPVLFQYIEETLGDRPTADDAEKILTLLKGFEGRQRRWVSATALKHWRLLTKHDYCLTVSVVTSPWLPAEHRDRVVELLNTDLGGRNDGVARHFLEKILG